MTPKKRPLGVANGKETVSSARKSTTPLVKGNVYQQNSVVHVKFNNKMNKDHLMPSATTDSFYQPHQNNSTESEVSMPKGKVHKLRIFPKSKSK